MAPENSLSSSKEKILKTKRDILKIVEAMLEKNIEKEWFLENCTKLCQADFDDVAQERSIEHQCGYPLCSNILKQVKKQQYHICKVTNKVYDITERKNFCSNECYKASGYIKGQMHSLPLYMRRSNTPSAKLKLLAESDNRGSAGEELVFHYSLSEKEISETEAETLVSANLTNMLQEDIKDCAEHLADLKIKENVYKTKYVFGMEEDLLQRTNKEDDSESNASDISDTEDKTLFPDYDNLEVLSNKHMPVPEKTKQILLIDPLKASKVSVSNSTNLPIGFVAKVFQDWFTEETMKYLLGEKQVYSIKADHLFKTMMNSDDNCPETLSTIKNEYINLCLKIDNLPEDEDEISDTSDLDIDELKSMKKTAAAENNLDQLTMDNPSKPVLKKPNPKRKIKRKSQGQGKSVSFASDVKLGKNFTKKIPLENSDSKTLTEPTLPLVDSLSQNMLRRQVLMGKLKNVYFDLLSVVELHYRDIKEEVKAIVDTFSLTPTNIIYKPKQFKVIGVVLLKILTNTTLKGLCDDSQFSKLCENSIKSLNISQQEIEMLVCDLISPNQVIRLQKNV